MDKPLLLIADDNAGKTMMMRGMLHRHGWTGEVLTATTTEEAKKLVDEHTVTHAFIDYYIPSENGPAVIAYIKAKNSSARVALVSSSDAYDNTEEAKTAGAEACICTTYKPEEVERAFERLIEEWKQ